MAVEQNARRIAVCCSAGNAVLRLADDDRMALRRPHAGVETEPAQVGSDMLGGVLAIPCVSGIGGDRLDAQQRKQPLEAGFEIAIDAVEDRRQSLRCVHEVTICMHIHKINDPIDGKRGAKRHFHEAIASQALQVCNASPSLGAARRLFWSPYLDTVLPHGVP